MQDQIQNSNKAADGRIPLLTSLSVGSNYATDMFLLVAQYYVIQSQRQNNAITFFCVDSIDFFLK